MNIIVVVVVVVLASSINQFQFKLIYKFAYYTQSQNNKR